MVYDYVFVILVYRNTTDLIDFFKSFKLQHSKVIVVNSFFDKESEDEFRLIAMCNNADFISIPNKGYGFGNNRGCQYAIDNFDFSYLVISNADILIENYLPISGLPTNAIIAPEIRTLRGKNQNPYSVYCNKTMDGLKYWLLKSNKKALLLLLFAFIRLSREFFLLYSKIIKRRIRRVSSAHGAHFLIDKKSLMRIKPLYNERMFLFCEEEHLAKLAKHYEIPIYYMCDIKVLHKEDGSIGISNINLNKALIKSYIEFYKYWYL